MTKLLAPLVPVVLVAAFALTGCAGAAAPEPASPANSEAAVETPEAPTTTVEVEAPEETVATGDSFVDGVLTTEDVQIAITDYRVIPVGEAGNEYGDVPVLAIWYDTTNLGTSDREISPMEFIFMFEAFQDVDPNRENTLNVAALPDDAFLDTQTENIRAQGTVSNAIAYELDDTATPVELVAGGFGDEIGRMTFNLN